MNMRTLFLFLLAFVANEAIGQQVIDSEMSNNRQTHQIRIKKTNEDITIDGRLDESAWQQSEVADAFHRVLPIDTGYANAKTTVRLTYDDENIYFGVKCYESMPGENIVESLRRDFEFGKNDNFLLFMDTYNDQTNGFSFGASAGGAKWDGLQSEGGDVSLAWDCKWEMEVIEYEDYWTIEMAIPFKNLQYQEGVKQWGINFSRLDLKENEKSSWAPVPRQFPTASLAFTGTLIFEEAPPDPKMHVSLIPYVMGEVSKDHLEGGDSEWSGEAGLDANVSLSTDLTLDLTVNPDYSQVEVDEQMTNLDRFELFFPEKRQFFLENKDLFTSYGKENIRPFFSRRIGLTNPVQAGARLSGKLNEDMRIGLMNMQTGTRGDVPAANYTVATMQHQVFSRSNVGAFFINKQLTVPTGKERFEDDNRFNRVFGVDYNLASANNRWNGKAFYHGSVTPDGLSNGQAASATVNYSTQHWDLDWAYDYVDDDYRAETGYIRRTGYHLLAPRAEYKFYPASEKIANHGPDVLYQSIFDPQWNLTDRTIQFKYEFVFLDRSNLSLNYRREYIKLRNPFDPTHTTGDTLAANTDYSWNQAEIEYESDPRSLLNYDLTAGYGGFFHGKRGYVEGNLKYRLQPYGSISLNLEYNDLDFPEPYKDVAFWLLGPKFDLTFTRSLFLTVFWQYNEQIDNINTNIRFQWRYAPVSDLYIVYTDNYFPENFREKNRALVAKLSYWFN
ncbi:MAG: carbohydrate binding family 9 domain-containing protein [Bacteroidales bacterium]|nr:carbohydrate binding family 9 domain-containing protein [Bacteroidales bacterium]